MNEEQKRRISEIVPKWAVMAAISGGRRLNLQLEEAIMSEEREEYKAVLVGEAFYVGNKLVQLNEVEEEAFQWKVLKPIDRREYDFIIAARCYIDEGCLVFENEGGMIITAYAPGQWLEVELVED